VQRNRSKEKFESEKQKELKSSVLFKTKIEEENTQTLLNFDNENPKKLDKVNDID